MSETFYTFSVAIKIALIGLALLFKADINAQPEDLKNTEWPKLMLLISGRPAELNHDSTGKMWFADWKGRRIVDLEKHYDKKNAKFLYVDSTGKLLSGKLYDHATPFRDGLAVAGYKGIVDPDEPDRSQLSHYTEMAIINIKGEEVLPMDERSKYVLGNGFSAVHQRIGNKIEVYNKVGKKLLECTECRVGAGFGKENFWMAPESSYRPWCGVKIVNQQGRILFQDKAESIEQINNWLPLAENQMNASPQPYYLVKRDHITGFSTVLNKDGKIIIDSLGYLSFIAGKGIVQKNNLMAVVDTNWKTIIPFTCGYSYIKALGGPMRDAYMVTKDNRSSVVNSDNQKIIPQESTSHISLIYRQGYYFEVYDDSRQRMIVSLNGDTVVDSRKFKLIDEYSGASGFFVSSTSTGHKGFLDKKGQEVIPCAYDNLFYTNDSLILFFASDGSCGYLDMKGHMKFRLRNAWGITSFSHGYALVKFRVEDKNQFSAREKIIHDESGSYQLQEMVIDSTGQVVQFETCPATKLDFRKKLPDSSSIRSFFHQGMALTYNVKTKKYGIVNDKMKVVLPAIYDEIKCRSMEYNYTWYYVTGRSQQIGHNSVAPDIVNGRLTVIIHDREKQIDIQK